MIYFVMRSVVVIWECIGSYIVDKMRFNEIFVLNFQLKIKIDLNYEQLIKYLIVENEIYVIIMLLVFFRFYFQVFFDNYDYVMLMI